MKIDIIDLFRRSTDGGVCVVKWRATKKDGEYQAAGHGAEVFHPDQDSPNFIPFNQLTEADVVGWLMKKYGWAEALESRLDADIEHQKNPPVLHGLPWSETDAV